MRALLYIALVVFCGSSVLACSPSPIACETKILPDNPTHETYQVLARAMVASHDFCKAGAADCEYIVAEVDGGWSVLATRTFAVGGKCVSRIGDERFYVFDASGRLTRVVYGR